MGGTWGFERWHVHSISDYCFLFCEPLNLTLRFDKWLRVSILQIGHLLQMRVNFSTGSREEDVKSLDIVWLGHNCTMSQSTVFDILNFNMQLLHDYVPRTLLPICSYVHSRMLIGDGQNKLSIVRFVMWPSVTGYIGDLKNQNRSLIQRRELFVFLRKICWNFLSLFAAGLMFLFWFCLYR